MRSPLDLGQVDAFLDHLVERRELAKVPYYVDELVSHVINLGLGVEATDAEADGRVRDVVAQAERALSTRSWAPASPKCRPSPTKPRCR